MKVRNSRLKIRLAAFAALAALVAAACGDSGATTAGGEECTTPKPPEPITLTLAAYSTPREVYGKIIPAFQTMWKEEHDDQQVIFQESYGGSTTQSQNVVNGFEADIVALSLGPDVDYIADEGLIKPRLDRCSRQGNGVEFSRRIRRPSR